MTIVKHLMLGLAVVGLLAAGACSSDTTDTSTSSVTAPTTPLVTQTFTGTVQIGGSDSNPFTVVGSNGTLSVTLTLAGPPATITEGLGVGQYVGTTCTLLNGGYGSYQAGPAPQLSGTIAAGNFCVMVYDVGNQSAPLAYSVTVSHY